MIGEATWAFDESVTDTSSVAITPDTTDSHKAILTVKADAPAGTLPIKVTIGGVTKTVNVNFDKFTRQCSIYTVNIKYFNSSNRGCIQIGVHMRLRL